MARQKNALVIAAILFLNFSVGVAAAEENDYYLGINAGKAKVEEGTTSRNLVNDLTTYGFTSPTVSLDQQSSYYKVLGGYQANPNFAVEAFYANLGAYDFKVTATGPATSGIGSTKVTAVGLDLVGIIPVTSKLSGFGRFGVYRRDFKGDFNIPGESPSLTSRVTSSVKFGAGLEWQAMPAVGLRIETEYYDDDHGAVDALSVGIVSHF